MLTAEGCAGRRERLQAALPEACEASILTAPEHLVYFAGYLPSPFAFNSVESAAALLLTRDRSVLIADNLLRPFIDRSHVDEVRCIEWYTGKKSAPPRREAVARAVLESLPRGTTLLGVDGMLQGLAASQPELLGLDPLIRRLRRSKDPDELAAIRRSISVGEAGHLLALEMATPWMSELDVFLLVQEAVAETLGEPAQIYGDFASGPRCAIERGGPPSRRIIQPGELFLLDFSVVVEGYRGDFTNTFAVGGEPTPRQRQLEDLCLKAMELGEGLLRPGAEGREIDSAIRGHFAAHGAEGWFPSHSGHGLGLGHPEPPYLVGESEDLLAAGDVVALEPGLYVPGIGGMRFEHNYVITDSGCERLTHHHVGLTR